MEEEWRAVVDHPGYQVSNQGQVLSKYGKVMHQSEKSGYRLVALWENGRVRKTQVHLLVLTAFVGPKPDGMDSDHIDLDRANNRLDNLRWAPKGENRRRTVRFYGDAHHNTKISEEQVAEIRRRHPITKWPDYAGYRRTAKEFGIVALYVSYIVRGLARTGEGRGVVVPGEDPPDYSHKYEWLPTGPKPKGKRGNPSEVVAGTVPP